MLFVYAMVAMSLSGALIATLNGADVSVVAGLLTFYFVVTALWTVRRRTNPSRLIERAGMFFALLVSLLAFKLGFGLVGSGRPETAPIFVFGIVGLLAAAGDMRVIRAGTIHGASRITRHLWRMCFAMWVAAASFFWGPPGRVPELIRIPVLLAVAVLLPVAAMLYWLWRLRAGRAGGTLGGGHAVHQTPALDSSN
jgi:hypothetical protein